MPRVIQPGGSGGKMRVRYTTRRKRGLVATAKRMQAEGMTLRAAALDKILRSKKKAALTGPSSQLKAIEDELLHYIFEQREQGVEIKVFTVVLRASYMSLDSAKRASQRAAAV